MDPNNNLDDPVRAFDDLRREVSLGLRAIQGLAAEHREQPDHTQAFTALGERLTAIDKTLGAIAASPAMRLTPQNLTHEIAGASEQVRAADAETLRSAAATSAALIHQLRLGIAQVREASKQKIAVRWAFGAGLGLGILLWAILPGVFMRALPSSWHAPEWMAARVLRTDSERSVRRLSLVEKHAGASNKSNASAIQQTTTVTGSIRRTNTE